MRSEQEIKQKLDYYQGLLAGVKTARRIDNPEMFLELSRYFPREAFEALQSSTFVDEAVKLMPPEDRGWVRDSLTKTLDFFEEVAKVRVGILRWVLEIEQHEGSG